MSRIRLIFFQTYCFPIVFGEGRWADKDDVRAVTKGIQWSEFRRDFGRDVMDCGEILNLHGMLLYMSGKNVPTSYGRITYRILHPDGRLKPNVGLLWRIL